MEPKLGFPCHLSIQDSENRCYYQPSKHVPKNILTSFLLTSCLVRGFKLLLLLFGSQIQSTFVICKRFIVRLAKQFFSSHVLKRKKVSPLLTFRQISPTMAPSSGHLSAFYHYVGLYPLERARNVIKGKIWTTMLPTVAIIAKRFPPSNSQNAQNVGNKFMGLQSNSSSYTWEKLSSD